jgi:hypothetical protein
LRWGGYFPLVDQTKRKIRFKTETCVSLLNYVGVLKIKLEDVENKNYPFKLSNSNLRFHSNLTSLKKELRQFVQVNGKKLVEIDMKSSQPYILSTILNDYFTNSTENGYNLFTIFPELYDHLHNLKKFIPTNTPERTEYILGIHFTPESKNNLQNFINYNFENDFYENILKNGRLKSNSKELNQKLNSKGRSYIKRNIMNYLFERNDDFKSDNLVVEKIDSLFPELGDYITRFNSYYTNSTFSYLLQRTESYIILKKVCGYINEYYPQIPFFTIHDSILTTEEFSIEVKKIMVDKISEVTGKTPVVTVKSESEKINIEEIWGKVNITTEKKFDKRKYTITQTNILKGLSLINDPQMKSDVKNNIQPFMDGFK